MIALKTLFKQQSFTQIQMGVGDIVKSIKVRANAVLILFSCLSVSLAAQIMNLKSPQRENVTFFQAALYIINHKAYTV